MRVIIHDLDGKYEEMLASRCDKVLKADRVAAFP